MYSALAFRCLAPTGSSLRKGVCAYWFSSLRLSWLTLALFVVKVNGFFKNFLTKNPSKTTDFPIFQNQQILLKNDTNAPLTFPKQNHIFSPIFT